MSADEIWRAFAETGEPVFYLLYRALRKEKEREAARGVHTAG